MLMEEEAKKADSSLADTVTKLALASKDADGILKKVKFFESKTMNSEVEIEEADKNLRETTKMASDNEQKLDELTRKLGVQEDELKRSTERAELAEGTNIKMLPWLGWGNIYKSIKFIWLETDLFILADMATEDDFQQEIAIEACT